ncbi:MAG: fructose-bisphosphatase class II, partial [Anaerolineales bacterium]|nr:fructose-bisphosphatase class II [Anaerolineales bacterium]
MTAEHPPRNIGLDLVRVTETAALAAGHWLGSGDRDAAHRAATRAMASALDTLDMDGRIVIGEDREMNGRSLL